MPLIPLEDNFTDVINKAQRGLQITDDVLATRAEISAEELAAVKAGQPHFAIIRRLARHLRLHPDALEALARKAWYPAQVAFPRGFAMFNTAYEDMTVNSYLVWDPRSREAAAFDTGASATGMIETIAAERLRVRHVFLTHTHEDHVADLAALRAATGADVWMHEREPAPDGVPVRTFAEGAFFHIGPLTIKPLLTSGHSPGQTTFFVTGLSWPLAICGDSIFASSMGGSPTHFAEQLDNNRTKILTLARDTVIAPGHGPLTTVAQERRHNPFFA